MKNHLQKLLKYVVLNIVFSTLVITGASAQINNIESFDGFTFLPAGWTGAGNIADWARRTTGQQPTCLPHSGAAMARFSRNAPLSSFETIVTPVVDYSNIGTDTARFSLWIFRDDGAPTVFDYITLYVNTSPSLSGAQYLGSIARSRMIATPDLQATNDWYQYSFDIPASFNTNTNYLLIRAATDAQMGNNIYIDDVEWNSFPAQCSGSPAPGSITASTTLICGGQGSADLTLNGQTTDAGIVYQWQSSASATGPWANFGTNTPTVNTGTISATTFYQCMVTCSNSSLTDSTPVVTITVSPNAAPVVAVTPGFGATYCQGGNPVQLVATGASNYLWTPSTGLNVNNTDTVLASPANNTQYTVVGTDGFGCTGSITVGVQSRPPLTLNMNSNPQNPCEGEPVTLNAQINGPGFGSTYTWNPGNLTGNNVTVNPVSTTVYTVSVSAFNGSCTASDSITINVQPGPVANFTYAVNGGTVTFTNTSANGTGYEWQFGDGNLSFQNSPVYTYSASGTYNVMLIASNGNCAPDTFVVAITVVINGLEQLNANGVSLAYNTSANTLSVKFNATANEAGIKIVNATGQLIFEKKIKAGSKGEFNQVIELPVMGNGVYSVQVAAGNKLMSSKFIKQ